MRRSLPRNTRKPPPAKKNARAEKPPPAEEPANKKESKVLKEASKAKQTLDQIKADEAEERARVMGEAEQKISGGDMAWLQYLRPQDVTNTDECAKMDKYNHSVFQHNNAQLPRINELMRALGRPVVRVDQPPKYLAIAKAKYEELLFNDEFRVLKAIEYLAERELYPLRDYEELIEAPKIADERAREEEIARIVQLAQDEGDGLIDISGAVGSTHKNNCTCENRWDGQSERCVGEGVRLRWRTLKDHHFLRPRIIPEKY